MAYDFKEIRITGNWLVRFLGKPLGIALWSIALIIGGGVYGEKQRDKGLFENKRQVIKDSLRIIKLEAKVDNLSEKLANRDCSGEVENYARLFQNLQMKTSYESEKSNKRLQLEQQKTKELEQLKNELNIK